MILDRASVLWPLETKSSFLVNIPSIFISKIMWVEKYLYPGLILTVHIWSVFMPSSFSDGILTFFIFFLIAFSQKSIPILRINLQGILYCFRYLNAKFMGGISVFLLGSTPTCSSHINTAPFHPWNDSILGPQCVLNPPVKCWLIIDWIRDHVLSKLHRVRCLHILDIHSTWIFQTVVFIFGAFLPFLDTVNPSIFGIARWSNLW